MRFAWLREKSGRETTVKRGCSDPLNLITVVYNLIWWIPVVLPLVKLIDYRANILDAKRGTSTDVEVTIIFTDGDKVWKVYSLSENINAASFQVLLDGFEYAILKSETKRS